MWMLSRDRLFQLTYYQGHFNSVWDVTGISHLSQFWPQRQLMGCERKFTPCTSVSTPTAAAIGRPSTACQLHGPWIHEVMLGFLTPRMGANLLAAAQVVAASSLWSAGVARKRFSAEASTGGVACTLSAAARHTMRDRRSAVRLSRRQAAAAVPSGFNERGETLPLKCGCRLCVCCVHGPCEVLCSGGCVIICSACVSCFPRVAEAAKRLDISRAWSDE